MASCRFTPNEINDHNIDYVFNVLNNTISSLNKKTGYETIDSDIDYANRERAYMSNLHKDVADKVVEIINNKNKIYQSLDGNYDMDYIVADITGGSMWEPGYNVRVKFHNNKILAKNVNEYNKNLQDVENKNKRSSLDKLLSIVNRANAKGLLPAGFIQEINKLKDNSDPAIADAINKLLDVNNIYIENTSSQESSNVDTKKVEQEKAKVVEEINNNPNNKELGSIKEDTTTNDVNKEAPEDLRGETAEETVENVNKASDENLEDMDKAVDEVLDEESGVKVNPNTGEVIEEPVRIKPKKVKMSDVRSKASRRTVHKFFDKETPLEVFHALVRARNQYSKNVKTFMNNLQNRIAVLEGKVEEYGTDEYKHQLLEAIHLFNRLKVLWFGDGEIERMDANNFMDTIISEMKILEEEIREGNNVESIFSRFDLLKSLLHGEGIDGNTIEGNLKFVSHEGINTVKEKLARLEVEFVKLANKTVIDSLMSSEVFRRNMSEMGIKNTDEIIKLITAKGDLSMMEQLFKGISFSDSDVGVMPEMMKLMFHKVQVRHLAEAEQQKVKLKKASDKVGSDTEFAREKDVNGNYTGSLIQPFRSTWNALMQARRTAKAKKKIYDQIAEKIDYTKIMSLHRKFGSVFSKYFTHSEQEMVAYETYLKSKLGEHYDAVIASAEKKLTQYSRLTLFDPNVEELNPFQEVQGRGEIEYMEFIPKQEHHWNRDYEKLTPEQKEYVDTIVSINKNYISPNVEGYGEMSYGKFFLSMMDSIKNNRRIGKKAKAVIKHAFKLFYINKDALVGNRINSRYKDDFELFKRNVRQHLGNQDTKVVYDYGRELDLDFDSIGERQGSITKDEMIEYIANALYKSDLETDITSITERMIDIASNNATRHEMLPVAQNYFRFFALHNGSKTGIQRTMRAFINQVIRGLREKDLKIFQRILATNIKLEDINTLEDIRKIVLSNKELTENDKTILKFIRMGVETDVSKTSVRFNSVDGDSFSNGVAQAEPGVDGAMQYYKNGDKISQQEFEKEYAKHLANELNKTGIPMTLGSIFRGLNSVILHKYLGLSPFSGIINRWQGMNDNGLADINGHYWTSGNLHKSQRFLNLANTIMYGFGRKKSKLAFINRMLPKKRVEEMKKLQKLTKMLGLNVFSDEGGLSHHLMSWSIKNPEFKNQMEIFLSILQDMKIKDIHGNEHQMFDGEQLTAYDMVDGTLRLKPEFLTDENVEMYEKFKDGKNGYNPMGEFVAKHAKAVSHIQNNFDNYDTTSTTNNLFLSMFSMLKKWIVSGYMQRFDAGEGRDLTFNKKKKEGRYITAMKHPTTGLSFFAGNMALALGLGASASFLSVFGAGAGALYLGYKMYMRKKFQQDIKTNAFNVRELGLFWSSALLATLDFPVRMLAGRSLGFHNRNMGIGNLTPEAAGNIRALGMELGNKMSLLAMSLAALAFLYDEDDDEESEKRRFYNYMANRLAALVYDNAIYHNPEQFVESINRVGIVDYTKNLFSLTTLLYNRDEVTDAKVERMINKAIPLPTTITNIFMRGTPFSSDVRVGVEQLHNMVISDEELAQKKLRILNENINHEIRKYDVTNRKTIAMIKKMTIGKRLRNESYVDYYERALEAYHETDYESWAYRYSTLDERYNRIDRAKREARNSR